MAKKKAKKRNPADTTMRNINALKKRVKWLEEQVHYLLVVDASTVIEGTSKDLLNFIQPKRGKSK